MKIFIKRKKVIPIYVFQKAPHIPLMPCHPYKFKVHIFVLIFHKHNCLLLFDPLSSNYQAIFPHIKHCSYQEYSSPLCMLGKLLLILLMLSFFQACSLRFAWNILRIILKMEMWCSFFMVIFNIYKYNSILWYYTFLLFYCSTSCMSCDTCFRYI